MERLKRNFYSLGYYCTPNLSIHQHSTQKLTWNFLVTLPKPTDKKNLVKSHQAYQALACNVEKFIHVWKSDAITL